MQMKGTTVTRERNLPVPQLPSKLAWQNPPGLKGRLLSMVVRDDRS